MPGALDEDDSGFRWGNVGGLGEAVTDAAKGTRGVARSILEVGRAVVTGPRCRSIKIEEFRGVDIDGGKPGRWFELWRRHICRAESLERSA